MADSSFYGSPSIETLSSMENYPEWCEKVKDCLNIEGLLCCTEEDFKTRRHDGFRGLLSRSTIADREKKFDFDALSLIRKYISTDINAQIRQASTAKEAWDMLKSMFQLHVNQNLGSAAKNDVKIRVFDEDGSYPIVFSRTKLFFDIPLTKSAIKHPFVMNFPSALHEWFPSTDIEAIVTYKGRDTKIFYSGKEKSFHGDGWKIFTEKEKLMEGDVLVCDVFQLEDTGLRLKVQILRSDPSQPEFEQRVETSGPVDKPKRKKKKKKRNC